MDASWKNSVIKLTVQLHGVKDLLENLSYSYENPEMVFQRTLQASAIETGQSIEFLKCQLLAQFRCMVERCAEWAADCTIGLYEEVDDMDEEDLLDELDMTFEEHFSCSYTDHGAFTLLLKPDGSPAIAPSTIVEPKDEYEWVGIHEFNELFELYCEGRKSSYSHTVSKGEYYAREFIPTGMACIEEFQEEYIVLRRVIPIPEDEWPDYQDKLEEYRSRDLEYHRVYAGSVVEIGETLYLVSEETLIVILLP